MAGVSSSYSSSPLRPRLPAREPGPDRRPIIVRVRRVVVFFEPDLGVVTFDYLMLGGTLLLLFLSSIGGSSVFPLFNSMLVATVAGRLLSNLLPFIVVLVLLNAGCYII